MKFGNDLPIRASALERDEYRCVACGFDLKCAIATHHVVPRALGGVDDASNLTTLCANCHKVVHWLSVGRRLDGPEAGQAARALSAKAYLKIRALAESIRGHSRATKVAGATLASPGTSTAPLSLAEALSLVVDRNKRQNWRPDGVRQVTDLVLSHIPADVRRDCAFRLPRGGQFFSVSVGHLLLFRTPAYPDGAKILTADMYLIWPLNVRMSVIPASEWQKLTAKFAAIRCFDLELSFDEAMVLRSSDWSAFAQACRDAAGVSRARPRPSNVSVADAAGGMQ